MIDKNIIFYFKAYVIGSLIIFTIACSFWGYLVVSKAMQSQKLIDSQIQYQNKATEQIGKPQEIIHKYEK